MTIKTSNKKGGNLYDDESENKPTFPTLNVEEDEVSSSSEEEDDIPKKKIIGGAVDDEEEDAEIEETDTEVDDEEDVEEPEDDEEEEGELDEDDTEKPKITTKKTTTTTNVKVKSKKTKPVAEIPTFLDEEIDEDEDYDEEDYDYLQKFERDTNEDYLLKFHPESRINNYDEVQTLATVVRDDNGRIIDPLHKTIPIMTKYEKARILGIRAKQLNNGSRPFITDLPNDIIDGYVIAQLELEQKLVPFIIRRPLPNGASEYWRVSDLQLIN